MPKGNENGENTGNEEEKEQRFEGEFDEARAKRLIQNLRDEISDLKESRDGLQAEADKIPDLEKRLADAETKGTEATRSLYVARAQAKHGLSDEEAEEFLSGLDDEEKILARAERLAGLRGPASQEEDGGDEGGEGEGGDEGSGSGDDLGGKPKPNLRPGSGGGDDSGSIDEDALVEAARERRGY